MALSFPNRSRGWALSFPNKSRAFDATRRAVRFWGYDSAMEVAFFVTEDALKRVQPHMRLDEAGILRAFDFESGPDLRDGGKGLCAEPQRFIRSGGLGLLAPRAAGDTPFRGGITRRSREELPR